jgi:hypothetical protein
MMNPARCPTVWLDSRVGDGDSRGADGILPNSPGLPTDVVLESTPAALESV